jgi:glycosyltransferase involved in cell wall biosynthesis
MGSVSVILPSFNRLDYLRAAVDSVFAQSFSDWQLIIADDGSDEPTRSYLGSLQSDSRVALRWLAHSGNPAAVRNAGLAKARGAYVAFLDSDDVWLPSKLERQLASLKAQPQLRWGYTGYDRIDAGGMARAYPGTRRWVPHRGEIFESLLTLEAEVSTPAVLVERRLLEEVGGFDEGLLLFEDYDMWLRLAQRSAIDLIDEPLVRLRSHHEHYSGGSVRTLESRVKLLDKMAALVGKHGPQALIGRLRAQSRLQLAGAQADVSRSQAIQTLKAGFQNCGTYRQWWTGLPKAALQLALPRAVLRRLRDRRPIPR